MTAPVVVFAVGNPSRGDDALGPLLAARFADFLEETGREGEFEILEDFQLQVEHALDLQGRALALFVDAGTGTPAPYGFKAIRPANGYGHTTHALEPEAVLQVFRQTEGVEPPPAYVLCVRGESFELGEDLTPQATRHLEAALELMQELARGPSVGAWSRIAEKNQR
ncbi:MAG TPA: hydrogenase maturation protease [Rhodocyclaceae bacterium]|nr:hydrogenase maturation protease [Rhodocyclaceae bacterium]